MIEAHLEGDVAMLRIKQFPGAYIQSSVVTASSHDGEQFEEIETKNSFKSR